MIDDGVDTLPCHVRLLLLLRLLQFARLLRRSYSQRPSVLAIVAPPLAVQRARGGDSSPNREDSGAAYSNRTPRRRGSDGSTRREWSEAEEHGRRIVRYRSHRTNDTTPACDDIARMESEVAAASEQRQDLGAHAADVAVDATPSCSSRRSLAPVSSTRSRDMARRPTDRWHSSVHAHSPVDGTGPDCDVRVDRPMTRTCRSIDSFVSSPSPPSTRRRMVDAPSRHRLRSGVARAHPPVYACRVRHVRLACEWRSRDRLGRRHRRASFRGLHGAGSDGSSRGVRRGDSSLRASSSEARTALRPVDSADEAARTTECSSASDGARQQRKHRRMRTVGADSMGQCVDDEIAAGVDEQGDGAQQEDEDESERELEYGRVSSPKTTQSRTPTVHAW